MPQLTDRDQSFVDVWITLLAVLCVLLSACGRKVPEGRFACGAMGQCPEGMQCADDGRCRYLGTDAGDQCSPGCRTLAGSCEEGTARAACGRNGDQCVVCQLEQDTCQEGLCVPEDPVQHLDLGGDATCAVTEAGRLYCWGVAEATRFRHEPFEVSAPASVRLASTHGVSGADGGGYLLTDGRRYGWGINGRGLIGDGTRDNQMLPGVLASLDGWTHLSLGNGFACGIRADGLLYCWGDGGFHRTGQPETISLFDPTRVGARSDWEAVATGFAGACGIVAEGGLLLCWGANGKGQGGQPPDDFPQLPEPTPISAGFEQVSVGERLMCAVTEAGRLLCWGWNEHGQLARPLDGPQPAAGNAVEISTGDGREGFSQVAVGREHVCAIQRGTIYCWGANGGSQLGRGFSSGIEPEPAPVPFEGNASRIEAGHDHTCALTEGGSLYCWGKSGHGQIGIGEKVEPVSTPTRVLFD